MREISPGSWPAGRPQVLIPFLLSLFGGALPDQTRYSIPEELAKNSVVGNLSKDLGFHVRDLPSRKLRISGEKEYFTVNPESGDLLVSDRIDREEICGKKPLCVLDFDAVAENPLNIFHIAVVVQDINDNTPLFKQSHTDVKIGESTQRGTTFPLDPALDSDAGPNSLQRYHLNDNEYFDLLQKQTPDGRKYPELVLKRSLDREEQNFHQLVLTAVDGGDPPQSGTTQVRIQVLDANDNPPVFSQNEYRVSLREDMPPGTSVLRVTATDLDEGINAEITYSFHKVDEHVMHLFNLNQRTGDITTKDYLDFEVANTYTLRIEAKDSGNLAAHCSIQVDVLDENDCAPEVIVTSVFSPLPEDSPQGTVVALMKTRDRDSGDNGDVFCRVLGNDEFILKSSSKNYYKLVTDGALDREQIPEYNITIIATDRGKPPLTSSTCITLQVADVNDNAPLFPQTSYVVHVAENNPPGASIAQVSASDPDLGPNGQVSYSIVASDLDPRALSSYVSVSAHSGVVFAQRAFDHEQLPTLLLVFADSLQEALPDISDSPAPSDSQAELQFYLVIALTLVSVLFLLAVTLAIALRLCRRSSSPASWGCFQPAFSCKSEPGVLPNYGEGTLPQSYNLCIASQSAKTEFNFLSVTPESAPTQDLLCEDASWGSNTNHGDAGVPFTSDRISEKIKDTADRNQE
ncbi:protocadherin gamma-B2-like [Echinops telfairi]|uniref:Protocadherin gamma-B2-like n=1 Tax=Echinops telfairi TaxID=9371 RepID=A0AC55CKA4_ECHTE|nr:protocadherin gamma-B2-like [Echinops telfairi]